MEELLMKVKNFSRGLYKALSVLLSFVLIFGALQTNVQAEPGTNYTYQSASALADGTAYVLVYKSGSSYYAVTNEQDSENTYLVKVSVHTTGDSEWLTSAVSNDMLWTYSSSGSTLQDTTGKFLGRSSSVTNYLSLMSSPDNYANWHFENNRLYQETDDIEYYLTYNSEKDGFYAPSTENSNCYIFKQVNKTVSSIAIKTLPTKTTYVAGVDSFDPAGMVITATYNDATTEDIDSGYSCSPHGVLPAATTSVSISYGNQSAPQAVTMNAVPPVITTQPADTPAYVGDSVSLTVEATVADGGMLSYQWYSNTSDSNTNGLIIDDAIGPNYTAPTMTTGTYYYYCVVTNTDNVVNGTQEAATNTRAATVTVAAETHAETPTINADTPSNWLAVGIGDSASLSVTARVNKGALTYQWYSNTTGQNTGGSPVGSSSDNPSLTLDTTNAGTTYYYCEVTNTDLTATGNQTATATSRVAQVIVRNDAQTPNIGYWSPVDTSFYKDSDNAIIYVWAWIDSGVLSYQWYSNTTGLNSGGTPIGSLSYSNALAVDTNTVGTTYYYCEVTNTDSNAPGIKTATATSRVARVDISAFEKGTVLFTFDDGWEDQYTEAFPILEGAGFKATAYVNSEFIEDGEDDFMNLSQVQELNDAGWDIGNHTSTHDDIGHLTDQAHMAQLKEIYTDCANWLIAKDMPRAAYHVAYPSGLYSSDLIRLLKSLEYKSGRATMYGQQFGVQYQNELFNLPVYSLGDADDLLACLNGIDQAAAGGSTIILMLHRVEPEPGELVTTTDQLQAVVDKAKDRVAEGKISVMTITQWCAAQNQSPAGQTPPVPTVTNDDVANTVSGLNLVMEYKLDDAASYTKYDPVTFDSLNLAGNHTLAVRYAASGEDPAGPDKILNFTKRLVSLSITAPPANTVYIEGTTFDATDMVVTAHYDDGTSEPVLDYTIDPAGALATTNTKVTVSYTNAGITKTIDQPITVKAKKLSEIAITTGPTKKVYIEGNTFNSAGMVVTAYYDNGKSEVVTSYSIAPSGVLASTDKNVVVSYTFAGVTKTANQAITVMTKSITGLNFKTHPTTVNYVEGEAFNPAGLVLSATYNNGSYKDVQASDCAYSINRPLQTTDTSIDIIYDSMRVTQNISVLPKPREYSYNSAQLKDIAATYGVLSPMFDPDNRSYTLLLDEHTAKTTISPVLADASSKLYINGKRVASKTFTLATAKTTKVTIKVQPKTGKAMVYTVMVKRAASTNTNLAYIKAGKSSLINVGSNNYIVNLSNTQTSTKINLKLADKKAKYTMMLDGKKTSSKTVAMKPGTTRTLVITVTPQAGSAYAVTYTVTFVRAISNNDNLAALIPSKGVLTPAFSPTQTDYSLDLASMYSGTKLTVKLADSTAKYSIAVDGKKSGSSISLAMGTTKVVTITVTSQAGDIKTYTVTITRTS